MTKPALRTDQVGSLAFYMANPKCIDLSDPGTGKTPPVCVYMQFLDEHKDCSIAWVQPKGLMEKNRREIMRFTNIPEDRIVIVDGTKEQIEKQLATPAAVYLMGPRRFTLIWRQLPKRVKAVFVDEQQKCFKRPTSAACQALFEAFRGKTPMEYFLAMTGTLISGTLDTAYPAIHVIEPRYYLSHNDFINQHAVKDFEDNIIGWRNHDKIRRILGTHGIRRTFEQVHGKQEIVIGTEYAAMTEAQRKMFDIFQEEAVLELEKFFLTGTEPGVAFIRARQIQEHPNLIPDQTDPGQFVDILNGELPGKLQLLEQHLEDHKALDQPLLIFSPMVPQQKQIVELVQKVGLRVDLINGSVPMKKRAEINDLFDAGELDALVLSPECADVGLNLQWSAGRETSHVVFVSAPYLDDTALQAIRRAIRGPRKSPLRVTFMAYTDSLDERIFAILKRKSVDAHLVDENRPIFNLFEEQEQ